MSSGLMVYLVPRKELFGIIGSRDARLLDEILTAMDEDVQNLDDYFFENDDEAQFTITQAMTALFRGNISTSDNHPMYGHAYDLVCRYYGDWLDNGPFMPCRFGWLERIDEILAIESVPLRISDMLHRRPPGVPCSDEIFLGYWDLDEIALALPRLQDVSLSKYEANEEEALNVVLGWLHEAHKQRGSVIVGNFN